LKQRDEDAEHGEAGPKYTASKNPQRRIIGRQATTGATITKLYIELKRSTTHATTRREKNCHDDPA
jgi:hypothetical protein